MSVFVPKSFVTATMTGQLTTGYTHSSLDGYGMIKEIEVINGGSDDAQVYVYVVPSGSSAGDGNAIMNGWTVRSYSNQKWGGWKVMDSDAYTIQYYCVGSGRVGVRADGALLQ